MDKLRAFDFFTTMIPGMLLTGYLLYILKGETFFMQDGFFLRLILLLLPVFLVFGHLISVFGYWFETKIDRISNFISKSKTEHPLVKIFPKYQFVEKEIIILFPELKKENANPSVFYDSIFDKCRILIYQQDFSERAQSISIQATFYRNMVAFSVLLVLIQLVCSFFLDKYIAVGFEPAHLWIISVGIFVLGIYSRWISQNLYKKWFYEILNNAEIYFKIKN